MAAPPSTYGSKVSAARIMRDLEAELTTLARQASDNAEIPSWDVEKIPTIRETIKNVEKKQRSLRPELERHRRGITRAGQSLVGSRLEIDETKRLIGDERMGKWQQTGGTLLEEHLAEHGSAKQELLDAMRDMCEIETRPLPSNWKPEGVPEAQITVLLGDQAAVTPNFLFERVQHWYSRFDERRKAADTLQEKVSSLEEEAVKARQAKDVQYENEKSSLEDKCREYEEKIAQLEKSLSIAEATIKESEGKLTSQKEEMGRRSTLYDEYKQNLLAELNQPIEEGDAQLTIVKKVSAMRLQQEEDSKAKTNLETKIREIQSEKGELVQKVEELQKDLQAKPDKIAILKEYGFNSGEDLVEKVAGLRAQILTGENEIRKAARDADILVQTQKDHNKKWTNLFSNFVDEDVAPEDIAPIFERFDLFESLELRGTARKSRSFLADEYFFQVDDDLKDTGLGLLPSSAVAGMLAKAMKRRPIATDVIDDLREVQLGLQMLEPSMGVEPTRTNQDLFIKVVLVWLHNILETETSGIRLAMAIGVLTGVMDLVDSSTTFLQSFPSQLDDKLSMGLFPAAMALRCIRRMRYTPESSAPLFDETDVDFDQTIPRIAIELYENNTELFPGACVSLSGSFGGGAYTSMTLLWDDPRHQEFILFERADNSVVFWKGKWLFQHDYKGEAWEVRFDPDPAVPMILNFNNDSPLAEWMAEYHSDEYTAAYFVAYDAAHAK